MDYQRYLQHVRTALAARDFAPVEPPRGFALAMQRDESWGRLLIALPLGFATPDPQSQSLVDAAAEWTAAYQRQAGRPCHMVAVFPFDERVEDRLSAAIKSWRVGGPEGRWSVIPWTADLAVGLVDRHAGAPRVDDKIALALSEVPGMEPQGPAYRPAPLRLPGLDLGAFPVTRLIMAATFAYYLWTLLAPGTESGGLARFLNVLGGPDGMTLMRWGANSKFLVLGEKEQWRLLSHVLLHGGLLHLGFNMWALWSLGRHVELVYGSGRLLYVYLFAGVAGGFASAIVRPDSILSVGASGAIFGLLGALLYFAWAGRTVDWRSVMGPVAMNLMIGFFIPIIDQYAHVGGLVGGLVAGFLVGIPGQRTPWRSLAMAAGFGLVALVLSGLLPLG